jgi:hypothetical protein
MELKLVGHPYKLSRINRSTNEKLVEINASR